MSPLSVIFIILVFISVTIYLGDNYTKVNISKEVWLYITITTGVVFTLNYIFEIFKKKKKID